jgi:hypothetical protein
MMAGIHTDDVRHDAATYRLIQPVLLAAERLERARQSSLRGWADGRGPGNVSADAAEAGDVALNALNLAALLLDSAGNVIFHNAIAEHSFIRSRDGLFWKPGNFAPPILLPTLRCSAQDSGTP